MALAYTGFLLWQAWQDDYVRTSAATQEVTNATDSSGESVPQVPSIASIDSATPQVAKPTDAGKPAVTGQLVTVTTDTLKV
ncbi:MAG TPA: hypothetical protein ENL37_10110, partial [Desulfobacteraceae bacterium]|nr:hypothetical protein [Desulfobacteraceae bacterium]